MNSRPNLLLLSGGSKVAIARIAKAACLKRGIALHISDTAENVPSRFAADRFSLLPNHTETTWGDALQTLCEDAKIGLILPTRHSELVALSEIQDRLEADGTSVCLSDRATLDLCIRKFYTHDFLSSRNVPTPRTFAKSTLPESATFPLIAKPDQGSASAGIIEISHLNEISSVPDDWILQEKATGQEYTVNLYLNKSGTPLCGIPHQRLFVEAGEVVQAETHRLAPLIESCEAIAAELPGARGILNIQAFHDAETNQLQIIEINPRIGGGYPLCDAAKGSYIEWLCQEYLDKTPIKPFAAWTDRLRMFRYREAIFSQ